MSNINKNSFGRIIISMIIIFNIIIDQITKVIARKYIADYEQIVIIKNHLILTKVENDGAFLSAGSNLPSFFKSTFLLLLPILVLCYGLWYIYKSKQLSKHSQLAICCIIGGGIGNIFDRLIYGSVTDFLFIDFYIFKTGVFNVADMSIMLGLGLLVFQSFKQKNN